MFWKDRIRFFRPVSRNKHKIVLFKHLFSAVFDGGPYKAPQKFLGRSGKKLLPDYTFS